MRMRDMQRARTRTRQRCAIMHARATQNGRGAIARTAYRRWAESNNLYNVL